MKSHLAILKSSAWVGGSQGIVLLFTLARFKIFAVVLGTAGFGVLELLLSTWELGYLIGGLGLAQAGIRYIASARVSTSPDTLSTTLRVLRDSVALTAIIALAVFYFFRGAAAGRVTGPEDAWWIIPVVGIGVFFQILCEGEKAVILGFRDAPKLAFGNTAGIIAGTLFSIGLVLALKEKSVAWVFAASSLCNWLAMRWQRRRVDVSPTTSDAGGDASTATEPQDSYRSTLRGMLQLGLVLMPSACFSFLVLFLTKLWIRNHAGTPEIGESEVGLFGQAYKVSGLYVNFVLAAMAADFLPRLTESIHRAGEAIRNVNEQIEVGILMVMPGIIGVVLFRDAALTIIGSSEFVAARDMVLWFTLGCLGRVISWPVAYLFVAAERKRTFFLLESTSTVVHLALVWFFIQWFGTVGGAMAFAALYVFYGAYVTLVAGRGFGFRPSGAVVVTGVISVGLWMVACVLTTGLRAGSFGHVGGGVVVLAGTCGLCLWRIVSLLPEDSRLRARVLKVIPFGK